MDYSAYSRAIHLTDQEKFTEALAIFEKCIEQDPTFIDAQTYKGIVLRDLGRLEESEAVFKKILSDYPNDAYAPGCYGVVLHKMKRYEEAVKMFNIQIEASPYEWSNYAKKGQALTALNRHDEALQCLLEAKKIVEEGQIVNGDFRYKGWGSHVGVEELQSLKFLKEFFSLKDLNQVHSQDAETQKEIRALESKKEKFRKRIFAAVVATSKAEKQKENDSLKQELENIKEQQARVMKMLDKHEEVLQNAGVYDAAEIVMNIRKFEEEDPELAIYYKAFYWTLANYFQAYRMASTGMISVNNNFDASAKGNLIAAGIKKVASFVIESGKSLPMVGGFIGSLDKVVDYVFETVYEHKFNNKVNAINNIIKSKLITEQELSTKISLAAIAIIHLRRKEILYPKKDQASNLGRIADSISDMILSVKSTLIEEAVIPMENKNSPACQIALTDVSLLLVYMYKNSENIANKSTSLDKQLSNIIRDNILEEELKAEKRNNSEDTSISPTKTSKTRGGFLCFGPKKKATATTPV